MHANIVSVLKVSIVYSFNELPRSSFHAGSTGTNSGRVSFSFFEMDRFSLA